MLTISPKILHVNERHFYQLNFLGSDQWIWWRWCDADFNSVWAPLRHCLLKHPLKRDFLDIYLATFSESVTSKIQNLWGSYFYSKCSKFNLDFKNAGKNLEKVFCSFDNCIWIGIVKLSLWWASSVSLIAHLLRSSPKILHVNKRKFLEHNVLTSDQWIW